MSVLYYYRKTIIRFIASFVLILLIVHSSNLFDIILSHVGKFILIVYLSWQFTFFLRYLFKSEIKPENRAVLISGCDSGFGFELAQRLHKIGFHVFAGCLFPNNGGAEELKKLTSNRLKIVKLDVTLETDIHDVINTIKSSKLKLWALVNNAGISEGAFIEESKNIDKWHKVFNVNLFGTVLLTKQCLPLIRHSAGRIINVTSVLGLSSLYI